MKRRILTLVLALTLLMQFAVSVLAEEEVVYPRDRVGKIRIYTTATEQYSWEAALHEESEHNYTILLKPADIAAIAGVTLEEEGRYLYFLRNGYEVCVNTHAEHAELFLNTNDGTCYRMDSGFFDLSEMDTILDNNGDTCLFLPLEKMLYLLNVTWYTDSKNVFAFPIGDNMWDIVTEWDTQAYSLPQYSEVVGETVGEIWGNAFKYSLGSVADELDYRVLFNGNGFAVAKMEEALLELSTSAITRFSGDEADDMTKLMNSLNPPYEEMLARIGKIYEAANNIPIDEVNTSAGAVVDRVFSSLTEWTPKKVGTDMGTFLDTMNYVNAAWEAVQVVNRSKSWTETYVDQLAFLKDLDDPRFRLEGADALIWSDTQSQVRRAAASLHSEYGNELLTGVYEGVKQGLLTTVDLLLQHSGNPAYFVKEAYDASIAYVRTISPDFNQALVDADNYQKAKCEYNITTIVAAQYYDALEDLTSTRITKEMLAQARMLGTLTTNAAAHCYYNLYILEGEAAYLRKAQINSRYSIRLDNAAQYDARLILNEDFHNLYSSADGCVREQIPKEYVLFPADQVIVTVFYVRGGGEGYSWCTPEITVSIPGNEEIAELVTNSDALCSLTSRKEEDHAWLADMVSDSQSADLYENTEVDAVYATPGLLTIRTRYYAYAGGAHPLHSTSSFTFDLTTGEMLILKSMLDKNNPEAEGMLREVMAVALEKDYGSAIMASTSTIASGVINGDYGTWELGKDGLTVQFSPGEIAAYAVGYLTVLIPYSSLNQIFDSGYLPVDGKAEGKVEVCSLGDPSMEKVEARYGKKTGQAFVVQGRVNDVTVSADGLIVGYANYLTDGLIWLPDAVEYTASYNDSETFAAPGPGVE